MPEIVLQPRLIATTVTANAALAAGYHTPVDATSGNRTMTLPTPSNGGASIAVEKVDASSNTVTISGSIRGGAATIILTSQYQTLILEWFGTTWRPAADHRTSTAIDAAIDAKIATQAASDAAATATLWKPSTAYTAGQAVVNPSGFVVTALTNFTSSSSYNAANWSDPTAGTYATQTALSTETTRATTAEGLKAPLASPALTGSPTAPTQSSSDSSTKLATTAYVQAVFASGYATETVTLLNAMTVRPDLTRQAAINTFIAALKTAGVWTLLDGLYVPAAHSAQAGLLNWTARARDLTAINAPTFTTDRGYTGDASTQYLTNGVNSNTSTNYVSATASMHFWSVSDIANDNYLDMTTDSGNAYINGRNASNLIVGRMNYSGTVGGAISSTVTASTGLSSWTRDSTNAMLWKNGSLLTTVARAPEALSAIPVYFLRGNSSSQYSARQMALGAYGGNLTSTQMAAFYNAALNYMIAVGVVVP